MGKGGVYGIILVLYIYSRFSIILDVFFSIQKSLHPYFRDRPIDIYKSEWTHFGKDFFPSFFCMAGQLTEVKPFIYLATPC